MDAPRWTARGDVFERHCATSLIVLPAEGSGVKLNGPAEVIWNLTRVGSTVEHISADVAATYHTEVGEMREFVVETLVALSDAGLVEKQ